MDGRDYAFIVAIMAVVAAFLIGCLLAVNC